VPLQGTDIGFEVTQAGVAWATMKEPLQGIRVKVRLLIPLGALLSRPHPKRGLALKGLNILAQGTALGNSKTNTSALKGRDIVYALMFGPYIPPSRHSPFFSRTVMIFWAVPTGLT
jgi:hypothetical protein